MPENNVSRRNLIRYGSGFLGTGLAATVIGKDFIFPQEVAAESPLLMAQNKDLTPEMSLQKLVEGNQRFVQEKRQNPNQNRIRLGEVSVSQAPFAAILGCADSRVPTEIVFDQGFGDLFVCRIAGNIATSEQIGSLEFGTMILGAKLIMVLGHKRCGAVQATIDGGRFPGLIGSLITDIKVGVERAAREPGENKLEMAVKANVLRQVEVLNQSALLGDLIDKGKLKIIGGYYSLETGEVELLS